MNKNKFTNADMYNVADGERTSVKKYYTQKVLYFLTDILLSETTFIEQRFWYLHVNSEFF